MLAELMENGIEAQQQQEKEFFRLAEKFRPPGEQMDRMVFSG